MKLIPVIAVAAALVRVIVIVEVPLNGISAGEKDFVTSGGG